MNVWNDLDKITAFLKQSPSKILILDFDGTLTPIIKSPTQAKLSKKMKDLLTGLSTKEGFYLVILSGRELKDLKKRINLQNITYAGNHGLEGEILNKRYSFPLPDKTSAILKNIRKQLNKIADQFSGVFIEDKKLALSFHYRSVNQQQVPLVKSLFKEALNRYIKDGLVSIIMGKMVFDIRPAVNWDKGSFAKLVIKELGSQTNTKPIALYIGDDATDENVFRKLKKGITVKVGLSGQSLAKYRLRNTGDVFKFLKWINSGF